MWVGWFSLLPVVLGLDRPRTAGGKMWNPWMPCHPPHPHFARIHTTGRRFKARELAEAADLLPIPRTVTGWRGGGGDARRLFYFSNRFTHFTQHISSVRAASDRLHQISPRPSDFLPGAVL
uniref:Putative secreted protein n=1 Tax=Anopheles marajoara TaxID=58244 RepID=A0A2M4C7D3_9DIPT